MRRLTWTLLSLALAAAILLLASLWLARSEWGRRAIVRRAVPALATRLDGSLAIGRLEGDLTRGLVLYDVEVRDREGQVALRAHRVALRYDLGRLLRRAVRVDSLDVDGLELRARRLADGRLNLATLPAPARGPSGPSWTIDVAHARLDGEASFDDPRRPLRTRLHFAGNAHAGDDAVRAAVDALTLEVAAPLAAHIEAHGAITTTAGTIAVQRAAVTVAADGAELRRLVPAAELVGRWHAELRADGPLEQLAVALVVQPPRGRVDARAVVSVGRAGPGWQARLDAAGIDPGAAWRGAPHGTVSLEAAGEGIGTRGTIEIARLLIDVAGAHARGRGRLRLDPRPTGSGWLDVDAPDLSRLGALGLPGLSGRLIAHARLQRDVGHTRVDADVHGRALAAAAVRLQAIDARVHGVDLVGRADVEARGLQAGDTHVDTLTLTARGDPRALALRLDAHGPALEVRLAVHGTPLGPARHGAPTGFDATVDELLLAARGQRWQAAQPAHVRVDPALRVDGLVLRDGVQSVALDGRWATGRLDAMARGQALDLPSLLALAGRGPALPHTRLDVRAHLFGPADAPAVDVDLRGTSARDDALDLDAATYDARAHYGQGRLHGDVNARARDHTLEARFDLPLGALEGRRIAVDLTAHSDRISTWHRFFPAALQPLDGAATLRLRVDGTAGRPRLEARLEGRALRLQDWQDSQVAIEAHYLDCKLDLQAQAQLRTATGPAGALDGRVSVPIDLGRGVATGLQRLAHATPIAATVALDGLDLAHVPGHAGLPVETGVVGGKLDVSGTLHEPVVQLRVDGRGLAGPRFSQVDARAQLSYARAQARLQAAADLHGAPIVTVTGRTTLPFQHVVDGERWQDAPFSVDAQIVPYDLSRFHALGGTLRGDLHLDGSFAAPRGRGELLVDEMVLSSSRFAHVEARAGFDGAQATAWARADQPGGGALRLDATVPVRAEAPVRATLAAQHFTLDVQPGAIPFIRSLKGVLDADVVIAGTRAQPTLAGTLRVADGAFGIPGDPRMYQDLKLDVAVRDGALTLNQLAVKVGGGTVRVTGNGQLDGLHLVRLDATAVGDRFPVVARGMGAYFDTTIDLHAEAAGARALTGRLTVRKGTVHLPKVQTNKKLQPLGPMRDVVFTDEAARADTEARRKAADGEAPFRAALAATIPGPFHVRSKEVNADLKGDLRVELKGPLATVSGHLEAQSGWVELLGRRYDIERARLGFNGAPELDPDLDIRVTREISDAVVVIEVRGTGRHPQLALSSEPPIYDPSQLVGIVVSGDPGTSRVSERSLDQKVVGALSGVIVGRIKDQIAPALPIDVLKVDVGNEGWTGYAQTRLEVGKYLTENVYVSYVHQFGQAPIGTRKLNTNQAQLEYRFKRRFELVTMFGDAGVGSINLFWTLRY
jgi:translocation and assembly module TamB